jgi:outer membrane protein insertion porin family
MIHGRLSTRCSVLFFSVIVLIIALAVSPAGAANEPAGVLILPFTINAPPELTYLGTQIPSILATHFEQDGARPILPGEMDQVNLLNIPTDPSGLLELGNKYKADRVVWGSFTLIGEGFSVDAHLLGSKTAGQPNAYHVSGSGIENLLNVLNDLARRISIDLFQRESIAEVIIKGNQRIETDAILRVIKSQVGSVYQPENASKDLRAIYNMGYFDDARVEAESGATGKIVTFHVKEKPTIRRIKFEGNSHFDSEKIKENMTLNTGAILNFFKIRSNIEQIESLYKGKNYHQIKVDYVVQPLENNQADLTFTIDEGPKLYVTRIAFEGNQAFDEDELKDEIKTSEKGFFYWLTTSGDLDRTTLDQDLARLNALYHNRGFIRARISDPQIDIGDEDIQISIKIDEGPQFKVGEVDVSGDLIKSKEELLTKLSISERNYYNREKVRNDVITLTDIYSDEGYANAEVKPLIQENTEALTVDITFAVQKNEQVYFEKILISGNTKTRDKVIRREMRVEEQKLFNGSALKRSMRNLHRLDYFEDIKVDLLKGSAEDQKVLKIEVKEKPTGTFSFGAGYSSAEQTFLIGSIAQRNFLGRGQILRFNGQFGQSTTRYDLSFTEPWFLDTRLSTTAEAYNQEKEVEDEYELNSMGGGLRFSYPVYDFTRLHWRYGYDITEIADVGEEASDTIRRREGTNVTSLAAIALGYDSRDRFFNPTEGSKHNISFEYAGLGGDVGYNKYTLQSSVYIPLFWGLTGFLNARTGYVHGNSSDKWLPDYEKFYLGGINSLRGFGYRGVHLTEINQRGEETKIGGDHMIQFNAEIIFPIAAEAGVMGVVFYDTGNVYDGTIDFGDLRQSAGAGLRWFSPIAPIRLEYGRILDRREGESTGRWEFTMGGAF